MIFSIKTKHSIRFRFVRFVSFRSVSFRSLLKQCTAHILSKVEYKWEIADENGRLLENVHRAFYRTKREFHAMPYHAKFRTQIYIYWSANRPTDRPIANTVISYSHDDCRRCASGPAINTRRIIFRQSGSSYKCSQKRCGAENERE